jgi:site-specific recombinase XerD
MTRSTGKRRHHFKNVTPKDPVIASFAEWTESNQVFFKRFREWLQACGYGHVTLNLYSVAVRSAIGLLNKPHQAIHPVEDVERVRQHFHKMPLKSGTRRGYGKGLQKLAEFLNEERGNKRLVERSIDWDDVLYDLPDGLGGHLRAFALSQKKNWREEDRRKRTVELLSVLGIPLRWMAASLSLRSETDITPQAWFSYVDVCIEQGRSIGTINCRLSRLQSFLRFVEENGGSICQRMMLVRPMKMSPRVPRDAPLSDLRRLLEENERECCASHTNLFRMGIMDRAWLHLMLYSGLRTCEVRRLQVEDLDFENKRLRIEQSKGLKDRLVYLNAATVSAVQGWLEVRKSLNPPSEAVFFHRHRPLTPNYCQFRLRTYGKRCGVKITPHQLRHSCATLLLNAGAPVLSVQSLLGHERLDTTLGYARLYDGTIAADYYRAMSQVEQWFHLPESRSTPIYSPAELVALVDSLARGTLNENQRETLHSVRLGILALESQVVKVHR